MCKVVAFTNMTKVTSKAPERIGSILLGIERDGYGYAVQGKSNVFGERCISDKFTSRLREVKNCVNLPVKRRQSCFGKSEAFAGPGIFHGRTSTNDKGLQNCHPMSREGWYLIHNGVVTDEGPAYVKQTTNDSEDVLHRLIQGIGEVERHLTGYYAFAAVDPQGRLHVCRDKTATLHVAWSPSHETYVFCTKAALLKRVAKALKMSIGPVDELVDDQYLVFEGNACVLQQDIRSRGWSYRESQYAAASIGRSLTALPGSVVSADAADSGGSVVRAVSEADVREGWPSDPLTRFEASRESEDEYYAFRREVDRMDAAYSIRDYYGAPITLQEFHKLDHISQDLCTIIRPDGTVIEPQYGSRYYGE